MAKKKDKKNIKEKLDSKVHKLDVLDIKLIKWSTVAFTLFILTLWTWLAKLVFSVHWLWFLVAGILLMIRPLKRYFKKRKYESYS